MFICLVLVCHQVIVVSCAMALSWFSNLSTVIELHTTFTILLDWVTSADCNNLLPAWEMQSLLWRSFLGGKHSVQTQSQAIFSGAENCNCQGAVLIQGMHSGIIQVRKTEWGSNHSWVWCHLRLIGFPFGDFLRPTLAILAGELSLVVKSHYSFIEQIDSSISKRYREGRRRDGLMAEKLGTQEINI